jgi:DNA polymerase III delta prime subunit
LNNYIWAEHYRPSKINDLVIPEHIKSIFSSCIDNKSFTHLLFAGGPGMGKTSLAKLLCEETQTDYLLINGSNEGRAIDTVRESIVPYASTISIMGNNKAIIIDEADNMTNNVQKALLNIIEEYKLIRFIFTCNNPQNIIDPIHSRCSLTEFIIPKDELIDLQIQTTNVMMSILEKENVLVDDPYIVAELVKSSYPDIRSILMTLENISSSGSLIKSDKKIKMAISDDPIPDIIHIMKHKEYKKIIPWITNNISFEINLNTFCINIHKKLQSSLTDDSIPMSIIILSDHLSKMDISNDPDIHFTAYITQITLECEWL